MISNYFLTLADIIGVSVWNFFMTDNSNSHIGWLVTRLKSFSIFSTVNQWIRVASRRFRIGESTKLIFSSVVLVVESASRTSFISAVTLIVAFFTTSPVVFSFVVTFSHNFSVPFRGFFALSSRPKNFSCVLFFCRFFSIHAVSKSIYNKSFFQFSLFRFFGRFLEIFEYFPIFGHCCKVLVMHYGSCFLILIRLTFLTSFLKHCDFVHDRRHQLTI